MVLRHLQLFLVVLVIVQPLVQQQHLTLIPHSGFNNAGPGTGATVDLTVDGSGAVTAAAVNAAGTKYNDGDRIIVNNPTAGEVLDSRRIEFGWWYWICNATAVGTGNLSDLDLDGLGLVR